MSSPPLIYLTHARSDRARAEEIHQALRDAGQTPWVGSLDLVPGDRWDKEIPRAQAAAEIALVLVSTAWPILRGAGKQVSESSDDWYANESIAAVIAAARVGDLTVIPILDGVGTERLPYGLLRLHGIEIRGRDLEPVLRGVQRTLDARSGSPSPASKPAPRSVPAIAAVSPDDIQALVNATIRRRLDRDLLLSWLPDGMSMRLPTQRSYFDQVSSDLTHLAKEGRLDNGQWPLEVWLRQAERLAGPFAEARIYRTMLDKLAGR